MYKLWIILLILLFVLLGFLYKKPVLGESSHTLVFLGDSMTESLGNFDELQKYLKDYYPQKKFLLLNYGYGSTNILSAKDRVEKETTHSGRLFQPINNIDFDYIFIESFGNNPLSDLPIEEGLKKQTESLDSLLESITSKHPKSKVIFVATIAPNNKWFGKNSLDISDEKRKSWAHERYLYIRNHIIYAKNHNIPVINIFEKSFNAQGQGKVVYLSSKDYIHPSPVGVHFISKQVADFIYVLYMTMV
jgi:lysophospholipase L1-like esterase